MKTIVSGINNLTIAKTTFDKDKNKLDLKTSVDFDKTKIKLMQNVLKSAQAELSKQYLAECC